MFFEKCKTGDILITRSTQLNDLIGDYTIGLGGLHTAIILRDPLFEKYSICGNSPSGIYCTILIDKICPIEEIIGQIWTKPNGCEVTLLTQSSTSSSISPDIVMQSILDFRTYETVDGLTMSRMAILAFFKIGYYDDDMIKYRINYGLCSQFVGKVLYDLGLIHPDTDVNSLLPHDFYELNFNQICEYKKIIIFDKDNFNLGAMLKLSILKNTSKYTNPIVDKLLKNYNFPRVKHFYPLTFVSQK